MAHDEPAIVDLGFLPNKRGGWWYREPSNAYTIQIVPSAKEQRGWCLGIAHRGPMQWGKKTYPAPEAAAFQAFRVTGDGLATDRLVEAMQLKQEERMQVVNERIKQWKEASLGL